MAIHDADIFRNNKKHSCPELLSFIFFFLEGMATKHKNQGTVLLLLLLFIFFKARNHLLRGSPVVGWLVVTL